MFRNFTSNGHTYRVSILANNIAYTLFSYLESGHLSDSDRDRLLDSLSARLGTDPRTAYRVARAMHMRGFLHAPIAAHLGGAYVRRTMDRIGYVAA